MINTGKHVTGLIEYQYTVGHFSMKESTLSKSGCQMDSDACVLKRRRTRRTPHATRGLLAPPPTRQRLDCGGFSTAFARARVLR
jgi:hypothetical protein